MAQRSATLSRYPARRKKAGHKDSTPPNWAWMMIGVGMGLGVAVVVFLLRGAPEAQAPITTQTVSVAETLPVVEQPVVQTQPQAPQYSFYELLPQQQLTATEAARPSNTPASTPAQQPAAIVVPGNYVLQVGSYTKFADADRQRATLALQGIVSFIEEAQVNQTLHYRVRVGPSRDLTELNRLLTQLSSIRIEAYSQRLGN